ncbi:serine/threonine protein kinase [Paenibacillus puldeungensis]|uniref:non-specific serine/threonine protein kinase n=1 Tax=Paenibacillus puldeungensis TaxID=696536 RepID=A0ABW3RT94_9BACL
MPFIGKLAPGDILAKRYYIERVIGQGGMSRVYLGADLKLPGKLWAIKESISPRGEQQQMAKEAELLISLNHHRLPRIVDFVGCDQDGYFYIVMDCIEGVHLDRYVKELGDSLDTEDLLHFALQITEGLHYLHTHDPAIIHRDLKPSNLLVDHKGEIRFIDFGIARMYSANKPEDTVLLGTVGFAAPEQYGGRQTDGRTDLYSLGAVILYLGTRLHFSVWSTEAEVSFRNQGHAALVPIVRRLLQTDPLARFASAEETSAALRDLMLQKSAPSHSRVRHPSDNKTRRGRATVIAVMGVGAGVGTTHTAIALAHVLSHSFRKVVIAEMEAKSTAFQRLARIVEGTRASAGAPGCTFRIDRVQYVRTPSRSDMIDLLTGKYEIIICDLGTGRSKELQEEFKRADISIAVGAAAEWKIEELERFKATTIADERLSASLKYCVPLASTSILRRLGKTLRTRSIFTVPAEPVPFDPSEETTTALHAVVSDILPSPVRSVRSFRTWQRPKERK